MVENLKRETRIQRRLNHPNIIKLHNFFEDKEKVYLLLEYAHQGSLANRIHLDKPIKPYSEKDAFIFFIQTALGLDYLHKKGVLHRDLKPENLLLDENGDVKLCDFGWSIDDTISMRNTVCGTLEYMAPEVINSGPNKFYNEEIDVWSLGVILYELLHGFLPEKKPNFDTKLTIEVIELLRSLLKTEPKERASLDEIFECKWVKNYEKVYQLDICDLRGKYVGNNNAERSTKTTTEESHLETEISEYKETLRSSNKHKFNKSICISKKDFKKMINDPNEILDESSTLVI